MSPQTTAAYAERTTHGEIASYSIGHFDIYTGPWWERAVTDQTAFLLRHLHP